MEGLTPRKLKEVRALPMGTKAARSNKRRKEGSESGVVVASVNSLRDTMRGTDEAFINNSSAKLQLAR